MADLVDKSGSAGSNLVQGTGTSSATFSMPGSVQLEVESVVATIDNTAGGATTPTLVVRDSSGEVIATKRAGDTIPAGDTGTVTFSLRNSADGASASGGIQFDTFPQIGDFLRIETTGVGPNIYGIQLYDDGNVVEITSDDGAGAGEISLSSPFIRFDTDGVSLRLLDSGETFFTADDAASWFFRGMVMAATGGTALSFAADNNSSTSVTPAGTVVQLPTGGTLEVQDDLGNPIFRVDEDGDLHGLTGKALVFDL